MNVLKAVILSSCGFLAYGFLSAAMAQTGNLSAVDPQKVKEAILEDVQKQKIDQLPEVQRALKSTQDMLLIRAWEQQTLKNHPVTAIHREAAFKEILQQLGDKEYRFYYVTLRDQAPATALIARLQAGLSWEKVEVPLPGQANQVAKPSITDWANASMVLPEFRGAIKLLKPGQVYPTPIKAEAGWHVLGLVETRDLKAPTPEQLKNPVEKLAERKLINEKLLQLIQKR